MKRESEGIKTVIDLIAIAVRTAPKSGGIDDIVFEDMTGLREEIASEMEKTGKEIAVGKEDKELGEAIALDWKSDAAAVRVSDGLVLIGVDGKKALGVNCGGCGFKDCGEFLRHRDQGPGGTMPGPYCAFKLMDLGIALGSAAKTLACHNVDNRLMYKIGVAAVRLKKATAQPLVGIPLSAAGKNIYFDRSEKLQARQVFLKKQSR